MEGFGEEKVFVFLDHEVAEGFHCFADSDNLGPWGTALVRELIPHLESEYRLIPDPDARFLTGQSSGGWGALYLQIVFPETFGGVWAASPDFVDFRSFGPGLDIYRPGANLYRDEAGCPRPAWRDAARHTVLLTRRQAVQMELLTGPGGQMQAFEAVYGTREDDGRPARLFDRETGAINPRVAASWARYDLCRLLRRHWHALAPRLAGRIHVVAARDDPFYLDEPVVLLAAALDSLGADADIRLLPAGGHDVWSDEIRTWMHDGMERLRQADR
jgi:S-formylglutathione hydrolase FrmB